ncbi:MAG TPA: HTTM domain-containing protein [Acidimicrobiales bacterium]|jgi:hypothetical protein
MSTIAARWDALFERTGSIRAVAVLRIALGPITLVHLAPFLRDARNGIHYDDRFWEPYAPWMPKIPGSLWSVLLAVGAVSAVLMALGVLTRLTTAVTFLAVATNLLASQTHFRHNRTFLTILLFGLTLLPAGRVLSVDAWWRRWRGLPMLSDRVVIWPLILLRIQVSLVYLASGFSKLIDPDWFGGLVLWDRVVRYKYTLDPTPLPEWGIDFLTWRPLYWFVAPVAVLTELFIGLGLWSQRTRLAAIWAAVLFHLSIELSASVEVFSLVAVAALAIWVTPSTRDRTVRVRTTTPGGRALALAVRLLDWFGRFRLEEPASDEPWLTLIDRDGTRTIGQLAVLGVLTRLPLTFPLAAPLLAVDTWQARSRTGGSDDARTSMAGVR